MSEAQHHRHEAAQMHDGDVVAILLRQHADITEALDRVTKSQGDERATNFEALKSFLAAHEAAEQKVVRPVSQETAGPDEAAARDQEEKEADQALAELTKLGASSQEFGAKFSAFKKAVSDHAEHEEHEEFPTIQKSRSEEQRIEMGTAFLAAFGSAAKEGS
jgi:hypothetical protein